jgi:superfamily I DNA and/or RNA helicase
MSLHSGWDWRAGVQAAMLCAINKHCQTLIMVGDHKQLPPTLMSDCVHVLEQSGTRSAQKLNQSLFERLILQEMPFRMLNTQYRMHPAIAEFPSKRVYDGKLLTGITADARPIPRGFPWPNPEVPVAFLGAPLRLHLLPVATEKPDSVECSPSALGCSRP